jgi:hypothetical protein
LLLFQGLIAATGNYGFFNLLTAVLCVTWLDDAFLVRLVPSRWRPELAKRLRTEPAPGIASRGSGTRRVGRLAYGLAVAVVAYASSLAFVEEMVRTRPAGRVSGLAGSLLDGGAVYVGAGSRLLTLVAPFRSISGYGLFRSMTTSRPEIAIETSDDAQTWHEVAFRYKAGDVHRRPRFVAPHQPRLDWQMWFAALDPRGAEPWLVALLRRILEGSPPVVRLLDDPALLAKPPRYVRLVMYEYGFTTPGDAAAESGAWWTRERRGELTPALSLDSFR